jgi:regulator of sigma E protease
MLLTAVTLVVVLSLLVFVHELGHFLAARRAGIRVDEFGFGFPPRAWGVRRGHTLYSVNWIPLGGFVKIKGETGERAHDDDSFAAKSIPVRAAVLGAGVVMNVALCWALLTVCYAVGMPQVAEDLSDAARVREAKVQVAYVLPGSPAEKAGIVAGDTVASFNGLPVLDAEGVRAETARREGQEVAFGLLRGDGGAEITKKVVPEFLKESGRAAVGVQLVTTGLVSYPLWIAPVEAAHATWNLGADIFASFGSLVRDLFARREVSQDLSGPVGIAFITADVAQRGFVHLLQFAAILSLNLGVINVLPIPALDGGRLAFLLYEAVRGKSAGRKVELTAHGLGYALLMILVVVITFHDVIRYGDRITAAFSSLF